MLTLTPGQKKQHARLLLERYEFEATNDALAAQAQAELMFSEVDLIEAESRYSIEEEDCTITDVYPIIGAVVRCGGRIETIQYHWSKEQSDRLQLHNMMIAFEWCHDPQAGLEQGTLTHIYIGTKYRGPLACWDRSQQTWCILKSYGNYGKNWACGGNWSAAGPFATLRDFDSGIDAIIKEICINHAGIKQAGLRVQAAHMNMKTCCQQQAGSDARQAAKLLYDKNRHGGICMSKTAALMSEGQSGEAL